MPVPRFSRIGAVSWLGLVALAVARSAAAAGGEPSPEALRFFETSVRPLLVENCTKCHGESRQKGGLRLDSLRAQLAGGDSGPAIVPGKPAESRILRAVRYEDPELQMPPAGKLPEKAIAALARWVEIGAPWPAADRDGPSGRSDAAVEAGEADRDFWSFRPIVRPPVPAPLEAGTGAPGEHPIDAFVLRELRAQGLEPAPPASPRELLRRVTFDLVGLPPAPEELEAFVSDPSERAYEKVVDRLLASPRYGERWGRHWLDLVRFAQTNGYERDDEKPHAWRYRDYVIRAFNHDIPYDRFVLEQLAGDELAGATHDALIATGFYRLGVWDDEPDDKTAAVYEELDDVVRTTGETFLGLTVGCARCHDHKFDPIPQEDYYSFAAFFRNVAPYGREPTGTHWSPNPDAIFTPLVTAPELAAWNARREELGREVAEARARLGELGAETAEEKKRLETRVKELESALEGRPFEVALSVRENGPEAPPTHVLVRGNAHSPGRTVEPGFLRVLGGERPDPEPPGLGPPGSLRRLLAECGVRETSGRRRALAEWIASRENPLTARVIANRVWQHHFGRGLVPTPNDFGRTGLPPSHPELLDWLAAELIDGAWSLKRLHRAILLSRTYRQSSAPPDGEAARLDPENRLLWRQSLRRLEAEAIRDSVLASSGELRTAMGGRGFFPELGPEVLATQSAPGRGWNGSSREERSRRSTYIFVKRTLLVPMLETFDMATPDKPGPARTTTTIAPQALILLNSKFIEEQAEAFATRLLRECGDDARKCIARAYRLALCREPRAEELEIAAAFIARQAAEWKNRNPETAETAARRHGLEAFARLVFSLNEFVYID